MLGGKGSKSTVVGYFTYKMIFIEPAKYNYEFFFR